jgi:hypothetical protein
VRPTYVSNVVSAALQGDQLLRTDDGHRDEWPSTCPVPQLRMSNVLYV